MDVIAVHAAAEEHLAYVREGNGPFFLEAVTYRFRGHSMGDPERYREKDEIEKWKEEDPIGIYHKYLVEQKIATGDELDANDQQVEEETQDEDGFHLRVFWTARQARKFEGL